MAICEKALTLKRPWSNNGLGTQIPNSYFHCNKEGQQNPWLDQENLDANTLPLLYKSMVKPHLEYGNTVWGPHFNSINKQLKRFKEEQPN